jgi:hypothetical protein
VIVPAVRELCSKGQLDDAPNIQFSSLSVDFEISALHNPVHYVDQTCFHSQFTSEIEQMSRIERLLEQGTDFVHMIYSFRSVSKAVPLVISYRSAIFHSFIRSYVSPSVLYHRYLARRQTSFADIFVLFCFLSCVFYINYRLCKSQKRKWWRSLRRRCSR